jgi:cytochrome P450
VSFNISPASIERIMHEVYMSDLDKPPTNKLRKVVFKPFTGLTKEQKLSIVGSLIGVTNKIHPDDIYACMIDINDTGQKITIRRISELLGVSNRTIHRHMCQDLKREKELLNQQI